MSKKKRIHFWVIFLALAIGILAALGLSLLDFLKTQSVNYTTAQKGTLSESFEIQGVITREESLVCASETGVVQYYYAGGRKLQKNTQIGVLLDAYYGTLLDEKIQQVYAELEEQDAGNEAAFAEVEAEMLQEVTDYEKDTANHSLSALYDLRTQLQESQQHRQEIYSVSSSTRVLALLAEAGVYLNEQTSETSKLYLRQSGIIEYSYDGFESWLPSQIEEDFIENYNRSYSFLNVALKNREKDEVLYRVITSEDWYITLFADEEEQDFFEDRDTVSFYYNGEEKMSASVESMEQSGSKWKIVLKLTRSMQTHDTERIATLRFIRSEETGIKISAACLVDRLMYVVPKRFVIAENNGERKLTLQTSSVAEGGATTVALSECYSDDTYYYFTLPEEVSAGATIIASRTDEQPVLETMTLGETRTLTGVYTVNGSTEIFCPVKVLARMDGYAIVEGISLYDRVKLQ